MDKDKPIRVRTSKKFKLKLRYKKDIQIINIKDFGFYPDTLLFQRVESSWFTVSAVLTPGQIKKEERELAERKKKEKASKEAIKDIKKTKKKLEKKK